MLLLALDVSFQFLNVKTLTHTNCPTFLLEPVQNINSLLQTTSQRHETSTTKLTLILLRQFIQQLDFGYSHQTLGRHFFGTQVMYSNRTTAITIQRELNVKLWLRLGHDGRQRDCVCALAHGRHVFSHRAVGDRSRGTAVRRGGDGGRGRRRRRWLVARWHRSGLVFLLVDPDEVNALFANVDQRLERFRRLVRVRGRVRKLC